VSQQIELACRAADRGAFDEAVRISGHVAPDRLEFAASQALIASVYRQVGRHEQAQRHDEAGLAAPHPDPLGRAMCRLGLTADRIGVGDALGAREALSEAALAVVQVPAWHWAGRWFDPWLTEAWVRAELHLLADEPVAAVADLEPFAAVKPRATPNTRWPYERAKTLLFLGVAQRCAGSAEAAGTLAQAADLCLSAGLDPLLLPAVRQLQEVDPAAAGPLGPAVAAAVRRMRQHRPPDC
jgi:hypothetical protein